MARRIICNKRGYRYEIKDKYGDVIEEFTDNTLAEDALAKYTKNDKKTHTGAYLKKVKCLPVNPPVKDKC